METIKKKFETEIDASMVLGEKKKYELILCENSQKKIQEFIDKNEMCICVYNDVEEWKHSTIAGKYRELNSADLAARIVSIDYDANEVEIEFRPECNDPNSYRYIDPNDYDKYELKLRGSVNRIASMFFTSLPIEFICFDLVKMEE